MAEEKDTAIPVRPDKRALIGQGASGCVETFPARWTLIRDLTVFQGKLFADGVRDLLLSPLSLIVGIYALLSSGERPGRQFYDLLHLGRRSDKWINLFGAADRVPSRPYANPNDPGMDQMIDQLEELILTQYEKGGLTAGAKGAIDRAIDAMQRKSRKS